MQVLGSQLHFLANRNTGLAIPPLFWPGNCIKVGGHAVLLSGPTVHSLCTGGRSTKTTKTISSQIQSQLHIPICGLKVDLSVLDVFSSVTWIWVGESIKYFYNFKCLACYTEKFRRDGLSSQRGRSYLLIIS